MKRDAKHWRDIVAAVERRALAGDEVADFEAEAGAASVGGDGLVRAFDRDLFVGGNQAEPSGGDRRYAAGAGMVETSIGTGQAAEFPRA